MKSESLQRLIPAFVRCCNSNTESIVRPVLRGAFPGAAPQRPPGLHHRPPVRPLLRPAGSRRQSNPGRPGAKRTINPVLPDRKSSTLQQSSAENKELQGKPPFKPVRGLFPLLQYHSGIRLCHFLRWHETQRSRRYVLTVSPAPPLFGYIEILRPDDRKFFLSSSEERTWGHRNCSDTSHVFGSYACRGV